MAYELEAILGTRATIEAARADLGHAAVVALGQDVAMIPLTDEVLDELISIETREPGGGHVAAILEWARVASRHGRLAYCSAAYFGGIGEQEATVFQQGTELERGDSVNRALQPSESSATRVKTNGTPSGSAAAATLTAGLASPLPPLTPNPQHPTPS